MMNKQKGWPQCEKCDQWKENKCRTVNEEGLSPCEVMSRKAFKMCIRDRNMTACLVVYPQKMFLKELSGTGGKDKK